HAQEIRVKQFMLYREKESIEVSSKEWQALIASMDVVNHFVDQSMKDLAQIVQVLNAVTQLASIADSLLKALAAV
ncbi:MAG: hypothetical protein ACREBW_10545, partial [Candidatus Micrarchaeaceae archaeon]